MIKLGIIYGGISTEHDVSIMSAKSILENLNKEKYEIHEIYINEYGKWFEIQNGEKEEIYNLIWTLKELDVVFPILHGIGGEDGTIQGMLELLKVPYVGCGVLASAVGMDKVYSKIIFKEVGIQQAKYLVIYYKNDKYYIREYDRKIIIEEGIKGKEVECAILEKKDEIIASTVGEIKSAEEFYSFDAKYNIPNSQTIIPAKIEKKLIEEIQKNAIKAFKSIDGRGLARVDFFIEEGTNNIYINEINTMPGFTKISMYPKLFEAVGISYSDLLDKLVQNALK